MASIAPGLDGYLVAQREGQNRQAQEMGLLMQLAQMQRLQQADAAEAEMRPLRLEAMRGQIDSRNASVASSQRQDAARGALGMLQATGGYSGPQLESTPTAVAPNDAEALRIVQEADARGQPAAVNVPNPANVRSLTAMAFPQEFGRAQAQSLFREPPKPEAPSNLAKLIGERDKLPPGHPARAVYDAAINKQSTHSPQTVVNVGPDGPLTPGKPASNKIDEGLLDVGMRLQGLSAIEQQFKPEYQQIGTRVNTALLAAQDKAGMPLQQKDKQLLTEFSQYKRNAINTLNEYIKSITGAAMSNPEAERILRGLPNPGTGLFDGDSPTEFKAKMEDAIKQSRMAEARFVYMKRNGMALGDIPLDKMPSLMNQRGAELEATIRRTQPQIPETELRKLVRRNLSQEFGLAE